MLRIFIHVLFIVFLVKQVSAQKTSDNSSDTKSNYREFNLSVFTGWSLGGPKNDIESNMSSSGLGHRTGPGWFGPGRTHPYTRKQPIFDIEASYYLAENKGVSLNFGLINNIEVWGYGKYGFMILKSEIRTISLNYVYRSKNRKHNFFVGPTYFIHSLKEVKGGKKSSLDNYGMPGVYIGYSLQMIQKKHWFLALKINYRWAPKSEIGPFVDEQKFGIFTSNPTIVTSEFSRTKVNVSCLNVGFQIGVRIYKD